MPSYAYAETILRINNLSVSYDKPILNGLTAEVRNVTRPGMSQGQVIGLLGPSGVGKTQLFRCLAGLQKPTSGEILLTSGSLPVKAGMVGVVTQNYLLFDHMTVLANLVFASRRVYSDVIAAEEQAIAMLARFHMGDRAHMYPKQLSGGQRQRVAIAQQLLCSRHFLLMDEPFSGLDPLMKHKVMETIREVSRLDELNTIIVTTHDVESALAIADTLWIVGRDWDANGVSLGANIKSQIDLIQEGLAWSENVEHHPRFAQLAREIKDKFTVL